MTARKFILFDFDGVIADSFEPAFEVSRLKCPHINDDQYRAQFEGNINYYQAPVSVHTPECRLDLDFFAEYIPRMKERAKLFPGIEATLTELEKDYTLVIISSTITSPIQEFLEKYNLLNHFDWVMGNDVHKSKIEKIKMLFAKYQTDANHCVFVTDTLGDLREAENMGVGAIGVTWGFHGEDRLKQGKHFRLINNPEELSVAIDDYFKS